MLSLVHAELYLLSFLYLKLILIVKFKNEVAFEEGFLTPFTRYIIKLYRTMALNNKIYGFLMLWNFLMIYSRIKFSGFIFNN